MKPIQNSALLMTCRAIDTSLSVIASDWGFMLKKNTIAGALLGILFLSTPAMATVIRLTDEIFPGGTDNVTRDTATGLEWLDWTATTGLTYFEAVAAQADGQLLEGWVHASPEQLESLYTNIAGSSSVANWPQPTYTNDNGAIAQLIGSFLGFTDTIEPVDSSFAMTNRPSTLFQGVTTHVPTSFIRDAGGNSVVQLANGRVPDDTNTGRGHALVRPAPESSADFDEDGDKDGRDFLAWQRGFGTDVGDGNVAPLASGNANGDQFVDSADLAVWQTQYGTGESPLSSAVVVPEPTSLLLAAIASFVGGFRRRRIQE
jgi:hypothetical protein